MTVAPLGLAHRQVMASEYFSRTWMWRFSGCVAAAQWLVVVGLARSRARRLRPLATGGGAAR
jgi:hypothetical protein